MEANHPKDEAYLSAVIPKRISLFEQIQANQLEKLNSSDQGYVARWERDRREEMGEYSSGYGEAGFESEKGRDTLWHSSAHILGQALEQEYGCKLGPCATRGEGFYYDAFYDGLALNDKHFPNIKAAAAKAAKEAQPFERIEVTKDQAFEMFSDNNFKDDAHIFCTEDQVMDEVKAVLEFIDYAYKNFGFTYELKLSTRPKNYLGDLKTWDKAENDLKVALDAFGKKWLLNEGDGAFYGPKIDITVSDAMSRKFQCATLQVMILPKHCLVFFLVDAMSEQDLIVCFLSAHHTPA
ncbi:hypothetical protein Rs2_48237 [Raphanus sativus]|nr:hypothetical protein Rs2_48237 [Raphanus sativus]